MVRFETAVHIERPADVVFAVVADPETYPSWNSAVRAVEPVAGEPGRYRMERDLPSGPAQNVLEIVSSRSPAEVVIRAGDGPTPFTYRYELRPANEGTDLSLAAEVELGGVAGLLGPGAAPAVRRGVDENLSTLKRMLEQG